MDEGRQSLDSRKDCLSHNGRVLRAKAGVVEVLFTRKEFRMQRSHHSQRSRLHILLISWGALVLIGACAEVPAQKDWIKIGETTREDVVKRYGQPDLVVASEEGETAIYRPRGPKRPAPQAEIPTMQVGPLGTVTTKMEPVKMGTGNGSANGRQQERPGQELRIRYNAQGIVEEIVR